MMKKRKEVWRVVCVLVVGMLVSSIRCEGGDERPEVAIIEQLYQTYPFHEKMAALLEAAEFLDDEQAVVNILDHLRQLDCRDRRNFDLLIKYRMVLSAMTCHPERLIIERLRAETDVWEKTKLVDLLREFYQPEVFVALVEQFDDTREIRCEHCWRMRLCDHAYTDFTDKLVWLNFVEKRHFRRVLGQGVPDKQGAFAEVLAYWDANKMFILAEIPKRQTPKHMLWRYMKTPTPEQPAE